MAHVTLTISDPLYEDLEQLRVKLGYSNRSAWFEYLLVRGLEIVRREKGLEEVGGHGSGVVVATA